MRDLPKRQRLSKLSRPIQPDTLELGKAKESSELEHKIASERSLKQLRDNMEERSKSYLRYDPQRGF